MGDLGLSWLSRKLNFLKLGTIFALARPGQLSGQASRSLVRSRLKDLTSMSYFRLLDNGFRLLDDGFRH